MIMTWAPGLTLESIEKDAILTAFAFYNRNIYITARSLRIDVDELRLKFSKFDREQLNEDKKIEDRKRKEEEFRIRSRGITSPLPIDNIQHSSKQEEIKLPLDFIEEEIKSHSRKMSYTKKTEHKIDVR